MDTHPKAPTAAELMPFLRDLFALAGPIIRDGFGHTGPLRFKYGQEAVTEIDGRVERLLRAKILERFPDHRVVGEEEGTVGNAQGPWSWHIDPIDGTLNYAIGVPLFSCSIGVLFGEELIAGGVLDPLRDELFLAGRGEGAFCNEEPIRVSERQTMAEAMVSTQSSRDGLFVRDRKLLHEQMTLPLKTRRLGSIALELAYVACGRFDLLLAGKSTAQNLYDVAGGLLLVEEAGGRTSDLKGQAFREGCIELIASNGQMHDEVLAWLKPWADSEA